ncbi:MAG: alanine racemase, partial [Bdellovibrionales bacterium]|nr:alanine racemase [Bdellovibrionales bacterium]
IRLRKKGIQGTEILVFGPFFESATEAIFEYNLTPVVSLVEQLHWLSESASRRKQPIQVHLKFNTGMNRLGLSAEKASEIADVIAKSKFIKLEGLCTHLASAEDYFDPQGQTREQICCFERILKNFKNFSGHLHLCNSAGGVAQGLAGNNRFGARPGIALYGIKPKLKNLPDHLLQNYNEIVLKPVMTLKSEIITCHVLKGGEKVSYGGHWISPHNSVVGVVPIGYADGYHRVLSNKGQLIFRGQRVPVVGIVCMDYIVADLTKVVSSGEGLLGEPVVLFGEFESGHLPVENLAQSAGTISYELLSGIGKRVPRKYLK